MRRAPPLFSKRAIADMLFKSLAALIRSHSTLLREQGAHNPKTRCSDAAPVQNLKTSLVYKVCIYCIRLNYYTNDCLQCC